LTRLAFSFDGSFSRSLSGKELLFRLPIGNRYPMEWNTQQLSPLAIVWECSMLTRSFRLAVCSTCLLAGLIPVSGCSAKRYANRSRYTGRVLHSVSPEYNPPAEPDPVPMTPPSPGQDDPAPPTKNTSELPDAPPRDDFESAERPGRHSASFGPYTGRVTRASTSTRKPGIDL